MGLKTFAVGAALGLLALAGAASAQDKGTIGIAMPTKSSARWIADGDNMVKVLQAKGYKTDLQYADNDIPNQLAQVENMITKKEKVLVIAAIDGTTLSDALQHAADAGIMPEWPARAQKSVAEGENGEADRIRYRAGAGAVRLRAVRAGRR